MRNSQVKSVLLTYFVMMVCCIFIRIAAIYITLPISETATNVIATFIIQIIVMFALSIFLFSIMRKQKPKFTIKQFGYSKISFKAILICIALGALCYLLNTFVASFFRAIIGLFGFENLPSFSSVDGDYSLVSFAIQVLIVAILPAICEETAHRGLLLHGLSSFGIFKALLISSLFFGLMHLSIQQFFYATVLGFIMGVTVIASKSIWPGIIIHFMNNFLNTYFNFASVNNWLGGNLQSIYNAILYSNGNVITVFLTCVLVIAILVSLIVILIVQLLKQTRLRQMQSMLQDIATITESATQNEDDSQSAQGMYVLNKVMSEYNINSIENLVFADLGEKKKTSAFEKICLTAIIVMGTFVTISTFIWGVL